MGSEKHFQIGKILISVQPEVLVDPGEAKPIEDK
jgi:hypothetical protein